MIIGFAAHGTGQASRAIDYMTAETMAAKPLQYLTGIQGKRGVRREPAPVVVRGDPSRIEAIIDSLQFKHKYTSAVLSFAPGEVITPAMEKDIMDEFECAAFAGLNKGSYDILWVRHQHTSGGRHELHLLTPRCELTSGKSLNIAPPRKSTRELFDTLRSKINLKYGLADPNDPSRARTTRVPGFRAKVTAKERTKANVAAPTSDKTSVQPNPDRLRELETRLHQAVQTRAEYNSKRYPQELLESKNEPPISLLTDYDRNGTPPSGGSSAPGNELQRTRPSICDHAPQFSRAVEEWNDAIGKLNGASERFGQLAQSLASSAQQEIARVEQQQIASAILAKYAVPIQRPATMQQTRGHGFDLEPDMPFGYS